jgi:cell division protein FtsB
MRRPIIETDEKRRLTLLRNRISAKKSVERRNELIGMLQQQNERLMAQNRMLEERIRNLENKLDAGHSLPTTIA